jgi:hypothetical protein
MRPDSEIQNAEQEFMLRVWYNRKLVMLERIQQGKEQMPPEEIMDGMTRGMREMEAKYSREELEYDDFEWGMINGKLSALRWVMGEDWDMLDS